MGSGALVRVLKRPSHAWLTVGEIVVTGFGVELGLRLLPFDRLLAAIEQRGEADVHARSTVAGDTDAHRTCRLAERVFRYWPFGNNCLTRSLVLLALLRRRGLSVRMRIGVAKAGVRLKAHAWLEHDGMPLSDDPHIAQRFVPLLPVTPSP